MVGLQSVRLKSIRDLDDDTIVYLPTNDAESVIFNRYMYYAAILCIMLNVDITKVLTKTREAPVSFVRTLSWLMLRELDNVETTKIAVAAKRSHSTVIVLTNNLKEILKVDKRTNRIYNIFKNYAVKNIALSSVKEFVNKQ